MKEILNYLYAQNTFSRQKAKEVLINLAKGEYTHSEKASFLTVFNMRSITLNELMGFRDAMFEMSLQIDFSDFNTVDLCGTGGDGKDTFNISTLSSFVVAGAGAKVAKHGNYGVSSSCGSSNLIEALGYRFTNDVEVLKQQIDKVGICFLHAPLFHPAMKNIAPVRKELGVKTFFNMLGPMVNPSNPNSQVVGVFDMELARMYHYIYQQSHKNYTILHSLDGYDEISLTGDFKMYSNTEDKLLSPQDLGFETLTQEQLYGGSDVASSVKIFKNILQGKGTEAQNNAVIANSGVAIKTVKNISIDQAIEEAKSSLLGGKAKQVWIDLLEL